MCLKSLKAVCGSITLVSALFLASPVQAKTPDGETPAEEAVCDEVKYASKGLYGLCVAYCEAQDLDSFEKTRPAMKLLQNYQKKMKPGDPEMPCLESSDDDQV